MPRAGRAISESVFGGAVGQRAGLHSSGADCNRSYSNWGCRIGVWKKATCGWSLVDHLTPRSQSTETSANLLLIVDEAHSLPLRLLEELRLLSNLVRQGQPRVRLVLAGGPQFEERLASPKLESFNQRIAARCYLEALDRAQTIDYVRHQINEAGGSPDRLFTSDALGAVYQATDGIPRLINQVCDHALIMACAGGVRQLTAGGIEEAWADLQQLPTPWNASAGCTEPGSIAERDRVRRIGRGVFGRFAAGRAVSHERA